MLSRKLNPSGSGMAHPAGTRMYCPYPPGVFEPRSCPMTITASPGWKAGLVEAATVPAASIPGVCG